MVEFNQCAKFQRNYLEQTQKKRCTSSWAQFSVRKPHFGGSTGTFSTTFFFVKIYCPSITYNFKKISK